MMAHGTHDFVPDPRTDGIWASHGYDAVAASTGFGAPDKPAAPLSPEARAVADACRADYAYLAQHKIAA